MKSTTMELSQWDKISEEIRLLKASLAAIHYHSGRGSSDKVELYSILHSIHEECEEALPELKTIKRP